VVEPLSAGVGGETRFTLLRAPTLEIGGLRASGLVMGLSVDGSLGGAYYDALLGEPFLARHRVIFDYPHHLLILEPAGAVSPDPFDRSGAFLVRDADHRFVIRTVAAGTPVAEAGLARGDVLRSLEGAPAETLSLVRIRDVLSAQTAAPVALVVRRHGRDVAVSIRLRDLI
jgi:hypothetical protein